MWSSIASRARPMKHMAELAEARAIIGLFMLVAWLAYFYAFRGRNPVEAA